MRPIFFYKPFPQEAHRFPSENVVRVEVPVDTPNGTHMLMILDADDSADLVVQYPNGEREIVWSVVKG